MKKCAFLALAAAVVLTACSKEDGNGNEAGKAGAIEFRPVVEKTRASLTDSKDDFKDFFTHVYRSDANTTFGFFEGVVYDDGTAWTYAPKKYYPTETGVSVSFYAYAPVKNQNMTTAVATAAGVVSFGYTVPEDQSVSNTAKDLLVSRKTEMTSGQIDFVFDHALSAVKFSAKNSNLAASELVYTISEVKITNLANVGTFTYDNTGAVVPGVWSGNTDYSKDYIAGIPAAGTAVSPGGVANNILSENDYLMVLPQEPVLGTALDPTSGAIVEVTFSLKDGEGKFIYEDVTRNLVLPTDFEFEMGKRYNFQIDFQASNAIVLNVSELHNWIDSEEIL